jgi:hypothetical protein
MSLNSQDFSQASHNHPWPGKSLRAFPHYSDILSQYSKIALLSLLSITPLNDAQKGYTASPVRQSYHWVGDIGIGDIGMLSRTELCDIIYASPSNQITKQWSHLRDYCGFYQSFHTNDFVTDLRETFPSIDKHLGDHASAKKIAFDYWHGLLHSQYHTDKWNIHAIFSTLGIPERMHLRLYFYLQSHFRYYKFGNSYEQFPLLTIDALRLLPELISHGELDLGSVETLMENTFVIPHKDPLPTASLHPPQQYLWELWSQQIHIPKLTASQAQERVNSYWFRLSSSARWLEEDWLLWAGDMTPLHGIWDHVVSYLASLNDELTARFDSLWSAEQLIITWVTEPWHSGSKAFVSYGPHSGYLKSDSLSDQVPLHPDHQKKLANSHSAGNKIDISSRWIHGVALSSYFWLWQEGAYTKRSFVYTHPTLWKKVLCEVGILFHLWHFDISVLPQRLIE